MSPSSTTLPEKVFFLIRVHHLCLGQACLAIILVCAGCVSATAQDAQSTSPKFHHQSLVSQSEATSRCPSSPFTPPKENDSTFVVDCGTYLDTGCSYKKDVPNGELVFTIKVTRVIGDRDKLKANGLLSPTATLSLPAFDVDFTGGSATVNPERDRVFFNGRVVPGEFLTGANNVWKENEFRIPVEWIEFPQDPGPGGTVTPADNVIRIQIDTANPGRNEWCTAIDWAALSIEAARPVILVHGILSDGDGWNDQPFSWVAKLNELGILNNGTSLTLERISFTIDTIQNNAADIARAVAEARQRWGIDKVNLVCHSKGGLDARHFVENDDSVEQVIQIGTPNAGAPLANFLVRQSLRLPPALAIGINLIALVGAPGGYQLTTPHMSHYNRHHGHNTEVRYTALAGRYRFLECSSIKCRIVEKFLEALEAEIIGGAGDLVVPVTSVHSLDYTENLSYESTGNDRSSTHTELNNSSEVFTLLASRLAAFETQRFAAHIESESALPIRHVEELGGRGNLSSESSPRLAPTASIAGKLRQGQVQNHTIIIDQTTLSYFTLTYPSGNLNFSLISPSGQRLDSNNIAANPNVGHDDQAITGGRIEAYAIANPEPGEWKVEVNAQIVTEPLGEVAYAIGGWIENPAISLISMAQRPDIRLGETLQLAGILKNNNTPITGALVRARILLPDDTTQDISLRDDGASGDSAANDGVYGGNFSSTSMPGTYRIVITANGTPPASIQAFSREALVIATVSRSSSTFNGRFRDFGVDTDNDGFFNHLAVEVGVNVNSPTNYRVFGILTNSKGQTYEASFQGNLTTGSNNILLRFRGEEIFRAGVNGPYALTAVRLAEEDSLALLPVDERLNAYQTAPYSFRDFQRPPIFLTGGGSAEGIDTNGNGRFDALRVRIELDVNAAGNYSWSARLVDRNGKEMGFTTNFGTASAGTNTLELLFNGQPIGQNGVDGPYFVRGLLFFGSGGSLAVPNAFTTGPLLASQFEGSDQPSQANLTVTKVASVNSVTAGSSVTYTLTLTNNGPGTASSVVVTNNLPAALNFVSCTATGGGVCGGTENNRTVTFASLAFGASATINITATANCAAVSGPSITNITAVSAATPDPDPANNSSTVTINVAAPQLRVTTGSTFDFELTSAARELNPQTPSGDFTVENTGCVALPLTFAVRRSGGDVASGKISSPDDQATFQVRSVNADGTEAPASTAQIVGGQRRTFRVRFSPLIPNPAGRTINLFANQVIPDFITSTLTVTPNSGSAFVVPLFGRVTTGARLINPLAPRLAPLVALVKSGDEFTVEFSVYDANHDVRYMTYQFLDANNRPVGQAVGFDLDLGQSGMLKGQSFTVVKRFTGAGHKPEVNRVKVTIYDGESSDSFVSAPIGTVVGRVVNVSGASFARNAIAAEAIVSGFGTGMANDAASATALPLPTDLAGARVYVRDSANVERLAPLFYVSPLQINYLIPAGTAPGDATVVIARDGAVVATESLQVTPTAPAIFAANSNGQGVAAALVQRVRGDGSQTFEPVAQYDAAQRTFTATPIDLGPDSDQVFLVLFGTGIRHRNPLGTVQAKIGGANVEVLYAGAQGGYVGLDQVNLRVPRSLLGSGEVDVVLIVDRQAANTVRISIR